VGGNETLRTDVRIIAATNRNLEREVDRGKFREDLFYRLNVVRVHLPPLRERPEDIRPLALFFLQRLARKKNNPRLRFADDALTFMESYNWPGNVRELENTIQRAVVLARSEVLTAEDLPLGQNSAARPADDAGSVSTEAALQQLINAAIDSGEPALAWIERLLAQEMLNKYDNDSAAAARALGLKPAAFKKLLGPAVSA
jgi:DNA-binding NtrC family response regulator